jgi:hypothetical protein
MKRRTKWGISNDRRAKQTGLILQARCALSAQNVRENTDEVSQEKREIVNQGKTCTWYKVPFCKCCRWRRVLRIKCSGGGGKRKWWRLQTCKGCQHDVEGRREFELNVANRRSASNVRVDSVRDV